jgi:hypothetical protein
MKMSPSVQQDCTFVFHHKAVNLAPLALFYTDSRNLLAKFDLGFQIFMMKFRSGYR